MLKAMSITKIRAPTSWSGGRPNSNNAQILLTKKKATTNKAKKLPPHS
jgi:hypothetical protein